VRNALSSGSTLNLNGLHLYSRVAQINGTVVNGSISQLPSGGGSLPFASATPGTIGTGTSDSWSFYGQAGHSVNSYVDTGSSSASGPVTPTLGFGQMQLLSPSGTMLATQTSSASNQILSTGNYVLPTTGNYTVTVSSLPGHTSTGHYTISVYDVTPNVQNLTLNQPVAGTIANPLGADDWTFSAAADAQVIFTLATGATSGLTYSLTGPNGFTGFTMQPAVLDL
jgi:hypothetical protein